MNKQRNVMGDKKKREFNELVFKIWFSAPAVLLYTVFMVIPICFSVYYSLNKWSGIGPLKFVGFDNYTKLFTSSDFVTITGNTLILTAVSICVTMVIAVIIAYLIYRTGFGFKVFRAGVFMPAILSPIIVGLIFSILFNADYGLFNQILRTIGLGALAHPWLSDPYTVLAAVIIPQVWANIGYYTIIFLAGMQSISPEVIESARIDGANSFQIFTKIVLPMTLSIIQIVIILVVTGALKSYGYSWAMTMGGPGVKSAYFTIYMYTKAFVASEFGSSSAVSVVILIYAMGFTVLFKFLGRKIAGVTGE